MARNQKQQREASEFEERVVYINRVSKTVKGGRRMSLVLSSSLATARATSALAWASPLRCPWPSPRRLSMPRRTCSTCR